MQYSIQEEEMKNELSVANLEQPLVNESSVAKAKKWSVRGLKVLLIVGVSLIALFFVAHSIWKFSGSNQWEFEFEKNGVKVYSLKAPGRDRIQVKGVVQARSALSHIVRYNQDTTVCALTGCIESRVVERVDDQLQYYAFRYNFPYPYKPREYVVRAQFHQNPSNKEVLIVFAAAPDKLPPNSCCFRVTDMNNTFRITPLENGLVEVEQVLNMSEGEFMPDWWTNRRKLEGMAARLSAMQNRWDSRKYQDEKFDFIKEK
jgi:START domain-containing protein